MAAYYISIPLFSCPFPIINNLKLSLQTHPNDLSSSQSEPKALTTNSAHTGVVLGAGGTSFVGSTNQTSDALISRTPHFSALHTLKQHNPET